MKTTATASTKQPPSVKPKAPAHLSQPCRLLWASAVTAEDGPPRLAFILNALEFLDRAEAMREQIAKDGLTTKTKKTGTLHAHPCIRFEHAARETFAEFWQSLGFHHNAAAAVPQVHATGPVDPYEEMMRRAREAADKFCVGEPPLS